MKASRGIIVLTGVILLFGRAQIAESLAQQTASTEEAGFERIFDGKTLKGWEGDPKYWRVENGALVGEITPETIVKQNTFIIWRGGVARDFELKVEYRISARGNSGINYRSTEVPGQPFTMRGYQADIDGQDRNAGDLRHTGQNYEERGRTFLARRGEMVHIATGKKPAVTASLGDAKELAAYIKSDDWNEYHLIARGNVMVHILNGHVMSVVVDDDAEKPPLRRAVGRAGTRRAADEGRISQLPPQTFVAGSRQQKLKRRSRYETDRSHLAANFVAASALDADMDRARAYGDGAGNGKAAGEDRRPDCRGVFTSEP